jgi:phage shock protein A
MEPTTTGFKKPWYKRSENTIGAPIVGLALLGVFTFIGIHVLPFILLAVTNTLYLAGLCAALAAIVFVALDKDVHTAVYYTWKSITRAIGYAIINQDPIGVIETSIKVMKMRLEGMSQNKAEVGGQLKGLTAKIKANADRADFDMKKAQQAEKQGDQQGKVLMALEAQGLLTSNKNLTETKNKIELMYRVLDKMVSTVDFNIKKTESELDIKKEERKAIMSAHSALTKGWKVLGGSSPEAEMFNKAMESIADTANQQLAEIDDIMDLSQGMIKGVDLEKGVMTEDAMKALEQWEKGGTSAILGTDKAVLISQAYDPAQTVDVAPTATKAKVAVSRTGKKEDKFDKLFSK